jgi:uncharacterized protein
MTLRPAVFDTNVIVSSLITSEPESPAARILDGMLNAQWTYLLSPALLAEYRAVLLRPKIRERHGLDEADIDRILGEIVMNAVWREPAVSPEVPAPDPGDDHLWALLDAQAGSVLVTGDRLLLDHPPARASVLSPRTFLELMDTLSQGGG